MAAILKFKMAAGYHGNRDGYLALKNSPSFKLYLCQFSRFCQKSERFSSLASPLIGITRETNAGSDISTYPLVPASEFLKKKAFGQVYFSLHLPK